VVACGRRWGKTTLARIAVVEAALRGNALWWVLPNYPMSSEIWRELEDTLREAAVSKNKTERRIDVLGGGHVTVKSADNPDTLRGVGLDGVVIDEAAMIREDVWRAALRPTLSDRAGWALIISTPRGRNWFFDVYRAGLDPDQDVWRSWQYPTSTSGNVGAAEIALAQAQLPERIFQQEYEAVFLEGAGAVFRNIAACLHAPTPPGEHIGHRLVAGVDWGKHNDYTAISIGCAVCRVEVALDRFNRIDYTYQRHRLEQLCFGWGVNYILAESNAMGEPIIEELARSGLPIRGFTTTSASKPPLIENLGLALERAEWQFIADPVGKGELEAYEMRTNVYTGRAAYSAPDGGHDDTVIARALMLRAALMPAPGDLVAFA